MNGRVEALPLKLKFPDASVDPERFTDPHGPVMFAFTVNPGPGFTEAIGVTWPAELVEPDQTTLRFPGAAGRLVHETSFEYALSSEPATEVTPKK